MFVKEEETTHAVKPLKALSITHKSTEWKFVLKLFLTNEYVEHTPKWKWLAYWFKDSRIQSSPFQALKWRSREEKAEQKTVETM